MNNDEKKIDNEENNVFGDDFLDIKTDDVSSATTSEENDDEKPSINYQDNEENKLNYYGLNNRYNKNNDEVNPIQNQSMSNNTYDYNNQNVSNIDVTTNSSNTDTFNNEYTNGYNSAYNGGYTNEFTNGYTNNPNNNYANDYNNSYTNEPNNNYVSEYGSSYTNEFTNDYGNVQNNEYESNSSLDEKDGNLIKDKLKKMLPLILAIMAALIIILIIIFCVFKKEKKEYCTYKAEDENFKLTDSYIITHKGRKITYVEGDYVYTAKTDEFKNQIEFIKKEKLPVIINSNGLKGFTHAYEQSDDFFRVQSYYDVSIFDFKKVDKNDNNKLPISYVNLKSNVTYKKLIKQLEKDGYECSSKK